MRALSKWLNDFIPSGKSKRREKLKKFHLLCAQINAYKMISVLACTRTSNATIFPHFLHFVQISVENNKKRIVVSKQMVECVGLVLLL